MRMPQSERSANIRKLLEFIGEARSKGVTIEACMAYTIQEITQFGATAKTAKAYVEALGKSVFITYDHPYWKITPAGKEWLERHSV